MPALKFYFIRIFIFLFIFSFLSSTDLIAATFNIPPGDTTELINAINKSNEDSEPDIINLAKNTTYTLNSINNINFSKNGLPVIKTDITINGNNSTISRNLSAPSFRIFILTNPGKLTINDLTISNGYDDNLIDNYGGGGILNNGGELIINNSIIMENRAEGDGGAGLWLAGNSISKINKTKILNNYAGKDGSGGAIQKRGNANLIIDNCEIKDNFASNIGGAIYSGKDFDGSYGGLIYTTKTIFLNNSAKNNAGAIFNYEGNINISNSCFLNNSFKSIVNYPNYFINLVDNYWGSPDGPSGIGPGSGDYIEGKIYFNPFLSFCPLSSPSPSPSLTPIVLLPGMGGSWNTQAIITGGEGETWKKTPFVKVYDNLKATLTDNAGYVFNQDYFEFYYDWRKPLNNLASQLNNYLENTVLANKPLGTKVNLIGHSLGGLVARTYGQNFGLEKVSQIITSGSPHQGAIPAYLAWAGAKIGDPGSWEWIAMQLYLQIHKGIFNSPVKAVQNLSPSLKDILPVFNFTSPAIITGNSFLENLNTGISQELKNKLTTIDGLENDLNKDTIESIVLGERSLTDKLMGLWKDGKPITYNYTNLGDLTVLQKSSLIEGTNQITVNPASHRELMEKAEGIQAILNAIGLNNVTPKTSTNSLPRNPTLLFFLRSPAELSILGPDGNPPTNMINSIEDKLIVIYNAQDGNYQLTVSGTGIGSYSLDIGQLTDSQEVWQTIKNNTTPGKIDKYQLEFNSQNPKLNAISNTDQNTYLELARFQLEQLKNYINNQVNLSIKKKTDLINPLDKILTLISQNQIQNAILAAVQWRTKTFNYSDEIYLKQEISQAIEWLIKAYELNPLPTIKLASQKLLTAAKTEHQKTIKTIEKKVRGENEVIAEGLNLNEKYLKLAETDFKQNNYDLSQIYSLISRLLSNEVRKLIK
mgnify:CR=1 FL=1